MPYRETDRMRARAAGARERILAAAIDQLAEGGYASATMSVLARRAGIATGSVYRHFPSKAELLAETFRRAAQREVDAVSAAAHADLPVQQRIASAVEIFVRRALAAPRRAYALIAEPVDPAVERERLLFRRAYADVFAAALHEAVDAGELEPLDAELVAAALVGALGEALVGPLAHGGDASGRPWDGRSPDLLVLELQAFCLSAIHRSAVVPAVADRSPHVRHP